MPRVRLVPVAVLAAAVVLTACSSSAKQSAPPSTTAVPSTTRAPSPSTTPATTAVPSTTITPSTIGPATVQIVSLTGPPSPLTCNAPTQVQLHWVTRGASKVELRIDGGPVFATYPGGKRDPLVPLTCDADTHTYELTARGANSATATKSLALAERGLVT